MTQKNERDVADGRVNMQYVVNALCDSVLDTWTPKKESDLCPV